MTSSHPSKRPLIGALFLFACGSAPPSASAPVPSRDTQTHIDRVERGLLPPVVLRGDDERFAIADRMRMYGIPGLSIAVVEHGRVVWAKGYGVADAATGAPVTERTLFQAASISKPVNALATLLAASHGVLSLDAPINDSLKSWKLPAGPLTQETPVTLRLLLSHRAGTTVHGFGGYEAGAPVPTLVQLLNGAPPANSEPVVVDVKPGTIERYSGGGIQITQLALTDQLGRPYAAILADTVLGPLGMAHSTFEQPLPAAQVAIAAAGHVAGQGIAGKRHVYPEQAAAGLWTTPSDLGRFFGELQRARSGGSAAISKAIAQTMTTAVAASLPRTGVGVRLGTLNDVAVFGHSGGNFGFECNAMLTLDGGNGVVIMANSQGASQIFPEIERAVFAAYGWPGAPQPIERATLTAVQRARVLGRWSIGLDAVFTVAVHDDRLMLQRPLFDATELVPVGGDAFIAREDGARFQLDAAGGLVRSDGAGSRAWTRLADGVRLPILELAAGRFDAAVELARELRRTDPASPVVDEDRLHGDGYTAIRRGNPTAAVEIFRLWAALYPDSANAHDSLGEAYEAAGNNRLAVGSYATALEALKRDGAASSALRAQIETHARDRIAKLSGPQSTAPTTPANTPRRP